MLRRSVILLVTGSVTLGSLACNLPVFTGLPLPRIPIVNPAPQEGATAVVMVPVDALPDDAAGGSGSPATADTVASEAEPGATGQSLGAPQAGAAETPSSGFTAAADDSPTLAPTVIIRFNTPTPQKGLEPATPTGPVPIVDPTATRPPLPTVKLEPKLPAETTLPTVILPSDPTPIPLVPGPTAAAPVGPAVQGTTPEVIWIEDLAGYPRSKVMVWRAGASAFLFGDTEYIDRIIEFNASPDGTWLAYTTLGTSSIWQVNTATGEQREIAPKYPGWSFRFPSWAPDGSLLAFVARADGALWSAPAGAGLWTSRPDGSDMAQVVKGIGWANRRILLNGWHPNGQGLVYAVPDIPGPFLPQWFTVPLDTGTSQTLPLIGTLYDISPDGRWLLGDGFTTTWPEGRKEGSFSVLMRIAVDGAAPQVLTPACRSDIMGQISPDGTRIAFLSMPSLGPTCQRLSGPITYELWVMNSDGSARQQIKIDGLIGSNSPQWSADGGSIYYSAWDNTGSSLWRVPSNGSSAPVQLAQTEGADRFTVVR